MKGKPVFQTGTFLNLCKRKIDQLLSVFFVSATVKNSFKMNLESLSFQNIFDRLFSELAHGGTELKYKMLYGKCQV
jgi:hypothetical protein